MNLQDYHIDKDVIDYLREKGIDKILKKLILKLVDEKPSSPEVFMSNYMRRLLERRRIVVIGTPLSGKKSAAFRIANELNLNSFTNYNKVFNYEVDTKQNKGWIFQTNANQITVSMIERLDPSNIVILFTTENEMLRRARDQNSNTTDWNSLISFKENTSQIDQFRLQYRECISSIEQIKCKFADITVCFNNHMPPDVIFCQLKMHLNPGEKPSSYKKMIGGIVILGPPLSGKKLVAKYLKETHQFQIVSRFGSVNNTSSTQLVAVDLSEIAHIKEQTDTYKNTDWILTGFPLTADQVESLASADIQVELIIVLEQCVYISLNRLASLQLGSRERSVDETFALYEIFSSNFDSIVKKLKSEYTSKNEGRQLRVIQLNSSGSIEEITKVLSDQLTRQITVQDNI
ncbi:hypothetical protein GJ496_002764 [Pomphorhynchus laevis]|nr:hypothetical protein GJ496_002764 [Pomphorhynchus laevis]